MAPPRKGELSPEEKDLLGVIAKGEPGPRAAPRCCGPRRRCAAVPRRRAKGGPRLPVPACAEWARAGPGCVGNLAWCVCWRDSCALAWLMRAEKASFEDLLVSSLWPVTLAYGMSLQAEPTKINRTCAWPGCPAALITDVVLFCASHVSCCFPTSHCPHSYCWEGFSHVGFHGPAQIIYSPV